MKSVHQSHIDAQAQNRCINKIKDALNLAQWPLKRCVYVCCMCGTFWCRFSEPGPQCQLLVCGWKGKISCRSFLPKSDRGHFLRLCGAELKPGEWDYYGHMLRGYFDSSLV